MKQLFIIVLSIIVAQYSFAQGVTKNGKSTNNGPEFVNRNGAIGSTTGVDKNGRIITAITVAIGDSYGGGKVFALTTNAGGAVTGGYVMVPNSPNYSWSRANALTMATDYTAAPNGYSSGWTLPTASQLYAIFNNRVSLGLSPDNGAYWTSDVDGAGNNSIVFSYIAPNYAPYPLKVASGNAAKMNFVHYFAL